MKSSRDIHVGQCCSIGRSMLFYFPIVFDFSTHSIVNLLPTRLDRAGNLLICNVWERKTRLTVWHISTTTAPAGAGDYFATWWNSTMCCAVDLIRFFRVHARCTYVCFPIKWKPQRTTPGGGVQTCEHSTCPQQRGPETPATKNVSYFSFVRATRTTT